jgi:hypothetical protein
MPHCGKSVRDTFYCGGIEIMGVVLSKLVLKRPAINRFNYLAPEEHSRNS